MTEERAKYEIEGEPEPGQEIIQDVHKDLVTRMIDTIAQNPEWFAGLLNEHQAREIIQAIKVKLTNLVNGHMREYLVKISFCWIPKPPASTAK
jgi:hypothetical protein